MNNLTFNNGAYKLEKANGEVYEGVVSNLIAHFKTDTITITDRVTLVKLPIITAQSNNLQIGGQTKTFEQIKTIIETELAKGGASTADAVSYDNSTSGLQSTNVQSAIDEIGANLGEISPKVDSLMDRADLVSVQAENVGYQGAVEGATNAKGAIDKVGGDIYGNYTTYREYDSEYFSGPQKWGFWVENTTLYNERGERVLGGILRLYVPQIVDGTYTIYYANQNKQLGATLQVTFSGGYCDIETTNVNYFWYRLITSNTITSETKCKELRRSVGMLEKLGDLSNKFNNNIDIDNPFAKVISNQSTINCSPYFFKGKQGERTMQRYINIINATDFHTDTKAYGNVCKWLNDDIVKSAISAIVCTGDYMTKGDPITPSVFKATCDRIVEYSSSVDSNIPILFVQGNHDKNWERQTAVDLITNAQLRDWLYNPLYNRLSDVDKSNFHFGADGEVYYSFKKSVNDNLGNLRDVTFVSLDIFQTPLTLKNGFLKYNNYDASQADVKFATYINKEQFEFLINALNNISDDEIVIIMKHFPSAITDLGGYDTALRQLLTAFREKTKGSITINAVEDIPSFTLQYDYTQRNESHILVLAGHNHDSNIVVNSTYGCPLFSACATSWYGGNYLTKSNNSITETNCDIVSINQSLYNLRTLRYGVAKKYNGEKEGWYNLDNPINF